MGEHAGDTIDMEHRANKLLIVMANQAISIRSTDL